MRPPPKAAADRRPSRSLAQLASAAAERFTRCFGHAPRHLVAAPGRVNLIGEHTDYNDGFALPMSIDRHVVIAADAREDLSAHVQSSRFEDAAHWSMDRAGSCELPSWASYLRGVLELSRDEGIEVSGFDAVVESNLPMGGGLSSSAALEAATATLVESLSGHRFDPRHKALHCQRAEHDYAQVPCGAMDQIASVMGQPGVMLLLDCRSLELTQVPLPVDWAILIADTRVERKLSGSEYAQRRSECEVAAKTLGIDALRDATTDDLGRLHELTRPVVLRRARHVVSENQRTLAAAAAAALGDASTLGSLLYTSHASLKDDYQVSCPELDLLVEIARSIGLEGGLFGSRMTGGGFGGCTVSVVRQDRAEQVMATLRSAYAAETGFEPEVFATTPVAGAHRLEPST